MRLKFTLLVLIIFSHNVLASVWLPQPNRYSIYFSAAFIDGGSKHLKQKRDELYVLYQQKLHLYETIQKEQNLPPAVKEKINKIVCNIRELLKNLASYQDDEMRSASIEYGINKNQSFGVIAKYKNDVYLFPNNKYQVATKSMDIFYKYKLFQNTNYIYALQSKVSVINNKCDRQEFFQEIAILGGYSKKTRRVELFTESAIGRGGCFTKTCNNKNYYSFSMSDGIKFPHGFMLINFVQYNIRRNYSSIYKKTIYEQVSIAKEISFGKLKQNKFGIQLGYFWDTSVKHPVFRVSGPLCSLWLNI